MYRVDFAPGVEKSLSKIPTKQRKALVAAMSDLARTPVPNGAIMMQGQHGTYRYRVGDYRVIYEVHHGRMWILVVRVGDRKEVYR